MVSRSLLFTIALAVPLVAASPTAPPTENPFEAVKKLATAKVTKLQVDLGYSIYEGVADSTTGVTSFKGFV